MNIELISVRIDLTRLLIESRAPDSFYPIDIGNLIAPICHGNRNSAEVFDRLVHEPLII